MLRSNYVIYQHNPQYEYAYFAILTIVMFMLLKINKFWLYLY